MSKTNHEVTSSDGPKCPYCGHVHRDAEEWRDVVSYWGNEKGPVLFYCNACDMEFEVNELVVRTWTSMPTVQSAALKESS